MTCFPVFTNLTTILLLVEPLNIHGGGAIAKMKQAMIEGQPGLVYVNVNMLPSKEVGPHSLSDLRRHKRHSLSGCAEKQELESCAGGQKRWPQIQLGPISTPPHPFRVLSVSFNYTQLLSPPRDLLSSLFLLPLRPRCERPFTLRFPFGRLARERTR